MGGDKLFFHRILPFRAVACVSDDQRDSRDVLGRRAPGRFYSEAGEEHLPCT